MPHAKPNRHATDLSQQNLNLFSLDFRNDSVQRFPTPEIVKTSAQSISSQLLPVIHCVSSRRSLIPNLTALARGGALFEDSSSRSPMERSKLPTELFLLDYARVSELLNDPTFWSTPGALTSILLIATNGSIFAHAYANTPSTRIMRSDGTSYSATYTAYMNIAGSNND